MAISPTVNQYMQQGADQPQMSAEQMFEQQFSDQAFNTLRAKYSALINNVITLKTMASNLDDGSAFGVFVVEAGNGLVYVPVAMSDGAIVSCEMVYDKDADQFYPLDKHTVDDIVSKSSSSEPSILNDQRRVEDTRRIFRNMMRPPTSSNVVLASRHDGVQSLPNKYKEMMSEYLSETNPELLGKLAGFYDVEHLAAKLASKPENEKTASEVKLPSFLSIDTLTKEAAERLSKEERKRILKDGFLAKLGGDSPILVAAEDKIPQMLDVELNLEVYPSDPPAETQLGADIGRTFPGSDAPVEIYKVQEGDIICADSAGLRKEPVLLCGKFFLDKQGNCNSLEYDGKILVGNLNTEDIDLSSYGCVSAGSLLSKVNSGSSSDSHWVDVSVIVPGRSGYLCLYKFLNDDVERFTATNNVISARNRQVIVSGDLERGYVVTGQDKIIVPSATMFFVHRWSSDNKEPTPVIKSYEALIKAMRVFGSKLINSDNGAGISITNRKEYPAASKTASFPNTKLAAKWLHEKFGMDSSQIKTVLGNKKSWVFPKYAYVDPMAQRQDLTQQAMAQQQAMWPQGPQVAEMPYGDQGMQPNYDQLADFAELRDPEMFDVGVLSTFSEYPDIKAMLVDYLPDFLAAEDKVGRLLLLFSSQKKKLEEFYGAEKCSTLMNSCRRIFSILGELVASLKLYINMV